MKIETTKERILEAASKCSTAKETLKTLFPQAFEEYKYFDLSKLSNSINLFQSEKSKEAGFRDSYFIQVRSSGEYIYKAFYLDEEYNWELKKDSRGVLVLIPTKK